jgi:hypothetical protein
MSKDSGHLPVKKILTTGRLMSLTTDRLLRQPRLFFQAAAHHFRVRGIFLDNLITHLIIKVSHSQAVDGKHETKKGGMR